MKDIPYTEKHLGMMKIIHINSGIEPGSILIISSWAIIHKVFLPLLRDMTVRVTEGCTIYRCISCVHLQRKVGIGEALPEKIYKKILSNNMPYYDYFNIPMP
ncbi:hypothetical protein H8356DRAFT_1430016 [Neocallimastix lanati (nom. inval.)]|nr:hypothetical protein H8356DRAFT_1430016 [Neocallimastix sp. JGI-2020a]